MEQYTALDAFKMAERLERNGAAFYRNAAMSAARVNKTQPFILLDKLAIMEDAHIRLFENMREGLSNGNHLDAGSDSQDESLLYLKLLVDTRVFFKKKINLNSITEIYTAAINAERDSIVFYLGIRELISDAISKSQIDLIIKEEMKHIHLLGKELTILKP
jgi:rubrerythrin